MTYFSGSSRPSDSPAARVTNVLYLVVAFTDEKQGIHDIFSDTRVIHAEK